ncbi:PREDICTED: uncharacterized protein LOC106744277 isoform X1 [Dinoponera quadriceps]|uniref:Uncharacterized protein LOC106744277 isoform X1 n=1 Tax=Dinoponera quadriceps TaxID=609295 RepID=A0A6P3X7Y5_DINQU|nr:PREDICTED: uncharacterized protein LOC106744277 isoform X1 [Dinoponera quadriceps]
MKMMLVKVIYRELVLQIQEAFVPLSSTSYHRHRRRQNSLITSVDFSEYPLRDHNVLAVAVQRLFGKIYELYIIGMCGKNKTNGCSTSLRLLFQILFINSDF